MRSNKGAFLQLVGMIIIVVTKVAPLFWYLFFCQDMEEKEKRDTRDRR